MGKKARKPSSPPMKAAAKHEIKPHLNSMKIMRPKVFITDTSNFKTLVQELTGNGGYPVAEISPPPPTTTWEVPFLETTYQDFHHHDLVYQENMMISSSVDVSSDFAASVEASPESLPAAAANGEVEERQRVEFYKGLEAMMMEMDSDYSSDYAHIFQQDDDQVCVYDYDLSNFV